MNTLVGQKIGNYVIRRPIGKGGMGSVFLAENESINHRVAIKVLDDEAAEHCQGGQRFLNEASVLAELRHANIVSISDFGHLENGQPYFVMEYLEGRTLRDVIEGQSPFSLSEVVSVLEQLCAALKIVHDAGIVHRDLKPENIMVVQEEPLRLKIIDFGLGKNLNAGQKDDHLTRDNQVMGSPMTMAPEQILADADRISPATDIYALGVILYWMLSGSPPFKASQAMMLLAMHIKEQPPGLDSDFNIRPDVARVVERCLAKDPKRRIRDANVLFSSFTAACGTTGTSNVGAHSVPTGGTLLSTQLGQEQMLVPRSRAFVSVIFAFVAIVAGSALLFYQPWKSHARNAPPLIKANIPELEKLEPISSPTRRDPPSPIETTTIPVVGETLTPSIERKPNKKRRSRRKVRSPRRMATAPVHRKAAQVPSKNTTPKVVEEPPPTRMPPPIAEPKAAVVPPVAPDSQKVAPKKNIPVGAGTLGF